MKLRLAIYSDLDRQRLVLALANNGYKVWVEEEHLEFKTRFFVCFNLKDKTEYTGNRLG